MRSPAKAATTSRAATDGLGILRGPDANVLRRGGDFVAITPEIMEFLREPKVLFVAKANVRSKVHRRVYMDYVGVKRFSPQGQLIGEFRIVGLFTSTAYTRQARSIPYLRKKVDRVLTRAGFAPESHDGKALVNVLETYPRDELFQIDDDQLYQFAQAIRYLEDRPRVRVLARHDRFDRFVSVLVYVPRERSNSAVTMPPSVTISSRHSTAACRRFIPTTRKARWCGCISSSGVPSARRLSFRAPNLKPASSASCGPGATVSRGARRRA